MSKPDIQKFFKNVQAWGSDHSAEILLGLGIASGISATVWAVKETPKALKLIEEKKREERRDELTPIEYVQTTWKCYIPAAMSGAFSIACLIGSHSVHARRNAALAAAYKLSETALSEYREQVIETIGEKKEKVVREKVDKARIEKNPVSKSDVIITEKGNTLCYDSLSGRYFRSDIDRIKKAAIEVNRQLVLNMYASLNDFYDELNLEHTQIGYELGWKLDDGTLEIDFSSQIADDGTPCIVVNYNIAPKYGFSSFY